MRVIRLLMLAALSFTLLTAQADEEAATQRLTELLSQAQTLSARFSQLTLDASGTQLQETAGQLVLKRPGLFRWHTDEPMEQLLVSDGKQVWLHDVDLNQVTVRPMSESIGATPAALLAGGALDKDFTLRNVTALSSSAATAASMPLQATSWEWVEALPRHKEGQFQSVRVGFRKGQLAALEILDSFGQRSLIRFTGMQANAALPASSFQFKPPAGADVVKQ